MQRRGFTLVELLIAIVIIGILASIILFALASVTKSAKRDKTLSTISKLNSLVMAKYESYRTRRVQIQSFSVEPYVNGVGGSFVDLNGNGRETFIQRCKSLNIEPMQFEI